MSHARCALCAIVAASGTMTGAAQAAILFSYEDPTALVQEFVYTQPAMVGGLGSLTYENDVIHNFVIDARQEFPGARVTVQATLNLTADVGPVTQVSNLFVASTAGSFEFLTTEMTPRVILSGTFSDGTLTTFFGSGSATAARNDIGGSLVLTAGPALFDILADLGYTDFPGLGLAPASASWSMVNISEEISPATLVQFEDDLFFPDFDADNAFVAQATVLPTPGSLALIAGAWVVSFASRRRRISA